MCDNVPWLQAQGLYSDAMESCLVLPHMCYAMRSSLAFADRDACLPSNRTLHTCEDDDDGEGGEEYDKKKKS